MILDKLLISIIIAIQCCNLFFENSIIFEVVLLGLGVAITLFKVSFSLKSKVNIPVIIILYFLFIMLTFVPFYYKHNLEFFWGNSLGMFFSFFLMILLYNVSSNKFRENIILWIVNLFILSIFIQLLVFYISNNGYVYKYLLKISYGKSNSIASPLIFCVLFLIFYRKSNKKLKNVMILLGSLSLFLTQSFSAIFIFFSIIIGSSLKNKKKYKYLPIVLVCFFTIALILNDRKILVRLLPIEKHKKVLILRVLKKDKTDITHGRLLVYKNGISNFILSPLFGNGLGNVRVIEKIPTAADTFKSHNLVIDLLAQTGIIGTVIYLLIILLILIKNHSLIKNSGTNYIFKAIQYGFIGVLLHSMVEPNFFSYRFDSFIIVPISFIVFYKKDEFKLFVGTF